MKTRQAADSNDPFHGGVFLVRRPRRGVYVGVTFWAARDKYRPASGSISPASAPAAGVRRT